MIVDLHHTVLLVTDLDRSLAFYCGTMGFEIISRDDERSGPFLDQMFGIAGVEIKLSLIRAGGEIIEVIQPVAPAELRQRTDASSADFGIARIGFEVTDIEQMVADLTAAGVEFIGDIVDMTVGHYAGGKVVFFKDPDGILLEFQQPAIPGQVT